MSAGAPSSIRDPRARGRWSRIGRTLWNEKYLWLMALPGLLFFVIYKYLPMLGVVIAFTDYNIMLGIWDSKWVGVCQLRRFGGENHRARRPDRPLRPVHKDSWRFVFDRQ